MNGWQRLFTVFAVLFVLTMSAKFYALWPKDGAEMYVFGCDGVVMLRPEAAKTYLAALTTGQGLEKALPYPWTVENARQDIGNQKCITDLRAVIDGTTLSEARKGFLQELPLGIGLVLGVLAIVYFAGWVIGWVWRGFFPKRQGQGGP